MQEQLLLFFKTHPQGAILVSLGISIVVAVLGFVPSVFITGANILFFGFWPGTALSFVGEAAGAAVAFWLYRKGFRKKAGNSLNSFPKAKELIEAKGKTAFLLIVSLRLLPFIPSGLVTFAASVGSVSLPLFLVASSIGKIPALLIEAYAVYSVTQGGWQATLVFSVLAIVLIYFVVGKIKSSRKKT